MDMVIGPLKAAQDLRAMMKMTWKLFVIAHILPALQYYWYVVIHVNEFLPSLHTLYIHI